MPVLIDPGPSEVGSHRMGCALRCLRLYALKYETDRKVPIQVRTYSNVPALARGSLLHTALAQHYGKQLEDDVDYYEWEDAVDFVVARSNKKVWEEEAEMTKDVMRGYIPQWYSDDDNWTVMEVEKELRAQIYDAERDVSYLYTQRADLISRDRWGKVWIWDHKSTYAITPKVIDGFALSPQFLGYQMLGKAQWGKDFGGVLLNMIKYPIQGAMAFDRPILPPAPGAVRDYKNSIIWAERQIGDLKGTALMQWPGMYTMTGCRGVYGKCQNEKECRFKAGAR